MYSLYAVWKFDQLFKALWIHVGLWSNHNYVFKKSLMIIVIFFR